MSASAIAARERLEEHFPERYDQTVLLVTVDSMFWCSAAKYEKFGEYHLIWTEHHGNFIEHKDEVAKIHVITAHPRQIQEPA